MSAGADHVVAGVSPSSPRAETVAWAAGEAAARGAVLEVVAASSRPGDAEEAREALRQAALLATERAPGVAVVTRVIAGSPEPVLRAEATGAGLLVVGADDQSPLLEAITGSVPGGLLTTAPCPLVVVPKDAAPPGDTAPILVGVDTAETSRSALDHAFSMAERSGRDLHVVHCWTAPRDPAEQRAIADCLAGYARACPDVAVTVVEVEEDPVTELARRSRKAALLVLGSRGRGRLASMAFGSVSRTLIRRCRCPVVVLRAEQERIGS
ncbi:universal stress protein [Actinophytocola sp.]|uniref:universal stress protein n=1 Tax=Actinophytocola sp. TaxID=1872138 RepID=UPI002D80298A|nr:universal stress protein [Actinophytocola sp.]HET9138226.1 universal stress protein [Actinophytocola sp.]